MILSIGEILADMVGEQSDGGVTFNAFLGGAPLNVAVNAKQCGSTVGFIGKVGNDPVGSFLTERLKAAGLDYTKIFVDKKRNTTMAFVTLNDGERNFAFFRNDTADYNLKADDIDLNVFTDLNIVHLGSLMLSEKSGVKFAESVVKKVKDAGKILSFDVNFRLDLFKNLSEAIKAYEPFVEAADILKFSDDEITAYTGEDAVEKAAKKLYRKDRLLLVTEGGKGSRYFLNNLSGAVKTNAVKPVDTTGAGDAFFGACLACFDGKNVSALTEYEIINALIIANNKGAETTLFKGAIKL